VTDTRSKKGDYLIIIPAYNEEETIKQVVRDAKRYADVCVVNDGSSDSTADILAQLDDIHVIHHQKNTNIPGAILDAMRYAVKKGYRYAITMDAGLSHRADEASLFINHPHTDLLIGRRTIKINTPLRRKGLSLFGNIFYNLCLDFPKNLFSKCHWDISSGYRRYSGTAMEVLLSKKMKSRSYDFLFESVVYIYRSGLIISEVPISYRFTDSSLKLRTVVDCMIMCFRALWDRNYIGLKS